MGGRAHGLALARPFALDGCSPRRSRARPSSTAPGGRLRAGRSPGGGRRARRHPGPDAADRQPQRDRQDGQGDRARPTERASLPPSFAPSPLAEIVVLSDFWSPIAEVRATIAQLSATGAHGHVVQIVDPAEETFPYSGRVEFIEPEGAGSITAGRAETWRATTRRAWSATAPRSAPRPTGSAGASPSTAPTGRRPTAARAACAHGAPPRRASARTRGSRRQPGGRMMGLPLGFAQPLVLLGLLSLPVLWWLLRLIPPRPRRIDFPPTRLLFDIAPKEETPRARRGGSRCCVCAGRAGDHRRRRARSGIRRSRPRRPGAARAPDRRRLRGRGAPGTRACAPPRT